MPDKTEARTLNLYTSAPAYLTARACVQSRAKLDREVLNFTKCRNRSQPRAGEFTNGFFSAASRRRNIARWELLQTK